MLVASISSAGGEHCFLEACSVLNLHTSIYGEILFLTSLWTMGNLYLGHHRDHLEDTDQKDSLH